MGPCLSAAGVINGTRVNVLLCPLFARSLLAPFVRNSFKAALHTTYQNTDA